MPEVQMPKLSDTMTEGTLIAWKKKKGEQVSTGEVLAEIETDKATMEWESPEDGVLTEIFVEEGGKVEVGQKIAFIGEKGEAAPAAEAKAPAAQPEAPKAEANQTQQAETEQPAPAEAQADETAPPQSDDETRLDAPQQSAPVPAAAPQPAPRRSSDSSRVKASPLARRIAAENGVNISQLQGSGPEGRVTEADVRAAMKSAPAGAAAEPQKAQHAPSPAKAQGDRIHLSGMRKVIAERLVESKGPVPHFYLNIDVDAGPLMTARAELKAGGEGSDTAKITVNDFVLKASVDAAAKVAKVNASFDGDAILQYADVDLAIAVAIEDGLVTPVVRAAQNKSLRELSETVKDLAHRARHKRMKPEEFQGGTFTVSNLGGYGIDSFSAIINPPQGFILAIGAISKRAVVDDCDQMQVGQRMAITMSCDHRVIDGALGAEYLKELRRLLENPTLLLI